MAKETTTRVALFLTGALALAGCDDTNLPAFLKNRKTASDTQSTGITTISHECDVEAPEPFQMSETGLWDGRPSLGGVWVAHAAAQNPERVIIRNESNGKFVIGALFRRERDVPGPRFQVSSDAAAALGMLAENPINLSVTALRKEKVAPEPETTETPVLAPGSTSEGTLEDPIDAAALDRAERVSTAATQPVAASKPTPKPAAAPKESGSSKPYIQIGIFNIEINAENTTESLKRAGMLTIVKPGKSSGKAFWRVIVGPTTIKTERSAIMKKVKDLGFADAYFVTN